MLQLPLPYRIPLMMAIGVPIAVKQMRPNEDGFDAEVNRVHAQFVEGMRRTYDACKALYGWQDVALEIK